MKPLFTNFPFSLIKGEGIKGMGPALKHMNQYRDLTASGQGASIVVI